MPETIQEAYEFMRSVNEYIIFKVKPFDRNAELITQNCRFDLIEAGATASKYRFSWKNS